MEKLYCKKCCLLESFHPSWFFWRVEDCIFWQAEKEGFFCLCEVVPSAFQIPKHLADFHCLIFAAKPRIPSGEEFLIWLCNQYYSIANWGFIAVKLGWCLSCLYNFTWYCYLDVGRDSSFFCVLKPRWEVTNSLVHVPGGINLLGCAHLWVLEKITTTWCMTRAHTQFSRTLMSRIGQRGMGQKFHWLPQLMVVIHNFIAEAYKAMWISPHPSRGQATRFLLVSSGTQMEKSDLLGWTDSLFTDSLILALLQPLHGEADLSQSPCLGYSIARSSLRSCFLGINTFLLSICDLRGLKASSWGYIWQKKKKSQNPQNYASKCPKFVSPKLKFIFQTRAF